jgi:hypothetical protein
MPEPDIHEGRLPHWAEAFPRHQRLRASEPPVDFIGRLQHELQIIENEETNVIAFIASTLDHLGATVELQETETPMRVRGVSAHTTSLLVAAALSACLWRRHRTLSTFLGASLGLAYVHERARAAVPSEPSPYTLTAAFGSEDSPHTLIFFTANSTAAVCLLELARQLQVLPPTNLRILLIIGDNPRINCDRKSTFVLGLDGLGGERLTLPRGLGEQHPFDAAALTLADTLAERLHLNVNCEVYLQASTPQPSLPKNYAGIRLGSLPAANAGAAVNFETLAAGAQLCTALVHRLDSP